MEEQKMKVNSDEVTTKAGSDQSAAARNATKKSVSGTNKGTKNTKVDVPIAGADYTEPAQKATKKEPESKKTNKGTKNTKVDVPIAGADYTEPARKVTEAEKAKQKKLDKLAKSVKATGTSVTAGSSDDENIKKSIDNVSKKTDIVENAKKKAQDIFSDMKRRKLSDEDKVDILMSMSKSKKKSDQDVATHLADILGSDVSEELREQLVKHVSATGEITRRKHRKIRARQATQTTGLSKSRRRQIARKAARTKKANPGITRRAQKKRKKAMRKRKSLGMG